MWKDRFFRTSLESALRFFRGLRLPRPEWDGLAFGAAGTASGDASALSRRLFASWSEAIGADAPASPERAGDAGRAARSGGEAGITELYRKYSPSLYWVCMRYTRNSEDAEDMVHQVFVKVQQNLAGFRGQSNVYTWMYRIAVNECIQMFRKRKFETDGDALPDLEDRVQVFPEKEMDAKLVLEKIMGGADPKTVEILFLLYLEGLKQEEVAEVLNISRTTINRKVTAFKSRMERFKW